MKVNVRKFSQNAMMLERRPLGLLVCALVKRYLHTKCHDPSIAQEVNEAIRLDEAGLGLDSLSRLELIGALTRYFDLSKTGVEDYMVLSPWLSAWIDAVLEHLRIVGRSASILFETAGSTGAPKHIRHTRPSLEQEVESILSQLLLDRIPRRIVSMVPAYHIYGFLATALLPSRIGCEVVDLSGRPPSLIAGVALEGTLIVGTPFTWGLFFDSGAIVSEGVNGITSAGPSPPDIWDRASEAGLGCLSEIFGSTESGGIGIRKAPAQPFTLMDHIHLNGPQLFKANTSFPLDIQDRLSFVDDRHFWVNGRLDGAVKVGGVNVYPDRLRDALLRMPEVDDATVRFQGGRLHAFVVPKTDEVSRKMLLKRLAEDFPAPQRPKSLTIGSRIPRDRMGKIVNWL